MKQYTLDTNAIRYQTNPSAQPFLRKEVKKFWKKVINEIARGESVLFIPQETIRELELQLYSLGEKETKHIADIISLCKSSSHETITIEIEHQLRKMTAYIRAYYGGIIKK